MASDYYSPPEVVSVMGLVDTYLRWANENQAPRGFERYHPSAFGKAQPLDAVLQTPTGEVMMRDIAIGDEICGVNGNINTVIKIHPQGVKKIFRVEFGDGDSTECCEDHLWEVDSPYLGFIKPKILSLKEIYSKYTAKSGHRLYQVRTPLPLRIRTGWSSLLQPYVLGALLGDGCLRCGCPMLTSIDSEIIDRCSKELPIGVKLVSRDDNVQHWLSGKTNNRNIVKTELQRLGLWGIKSEQRFIPESLLYVNEDSRWALIQGLMDTDGTVSKKGHPSFTSVSRQLIDQVAWLVKSLGGLTRLYEKETTFQGGNGQTAFTLHISHVEPQRLFSLTRKRERACLQMGRRVSRVIVKIIEVGEKEAQCITVSDPDGLYLTNNCILTHNCLRQMQYDRYAERGYIEKLTEDTKPFLIRIWGNGHSMHDRWRQYFEDIGILRGYWECTNFLCPCYDNNGVRVHEDSYVWESEKKLRRRMYGKKELQGVFKPDRCVCGCVEFKYHEVDVVSKELNFYGHCDAIIDFSKFDGSKYMSVVQSYMMDYLPTKPVVVDFKTINMFDFQDVAKGVPGEDYVTQLTIYTNILECDFGLLLYENKNNQQTCSFRIDRNEELFAKVQQQAREMNEMVEVEGENGEILHLLPPPKPTNKADQKCTYCKYKEMCHSSGIWDDPDLDAKRSAFYDVGVPRQQEPSEEIQFVEAK